MCGFAGVLDTSRETNRESFLDDLQRMGHAINPRGPDDHGEWCDPEFGIGLEHRRLSVIDLSPTGHQPMESYGGRFVIAYNGEVYNFQAIRERLEAEGKNPAWRGHSDTEVMLAAIIAWGFETALKEFDGMFAFALWDRKNKTLTLARDKIGEKPLYFGWCGSALLFGSTIAALRAHSSWRGEIDRNALASSLRKSCVPAPYSIYTNVRKVIPGTHLTFSTASKPGTWPAATTYWSTKAVAASGCNNPLDLEPHEVVDQLETLLRQAVKSRMHADVPLGAFLSGGIDSSTVVALMQAQSTRRIKTFSIGFHEDAFNEAHYAKDVATHLGTDHTELYVTSQDALEVIPQLPSIYDEPFSDSSQIPTFLVSKLARQQVTVSLSGDAGDELFAGYSRYLSGNNIWQQTRRLPAPIRGPIGFALKAPSFNFWKSVRNIVPRRHKIEQPATLAVKLGNILQAEKTHQAYKEFTSHWNNPGDIILNSNEHSPFLESQFREGDNFSMMSSMMLADQIGFLPDDILVKVDRAAMANSLETRIPLLDPKIIQFAWSLPIDVKIRDGHSKWPLREVLFRYVPEAMVDRPKMGFGVPVGQWLRKDLRDWGEALLDEKRLREEGFFSVKHVRNVWEEHQRGAGDWKTQLWPILMFQAWREATVG